MAIYLTLPQQVQKNKNDIKEIKESGLSGIILDNYIPKIDKGIPLGVATLDENGKVPAEQLPANSGDYLPINGGMMNGTIDMDGNIITDAAYIKVTDLHVKQIASGSGFQDVVFGSNISLNSDHKIIDAVKGTNVTDMATVENINDHDDSPFSHPDIRNAISALQGAWILRGIVEFTTTNITQTKLNDRIQALMSRSATLGDVLVDLNSHEWYFNGTNWDDFGQANIGLATASSDGLMSSAQFIHLSGLQAVIDGKLDKNNAITGDTKSKITYDEKGLVTGGSDLEATDIPLLSISKITNLQTELNNLSLAIGDVDTVLDGKITNLESEVDGKQDTLLSGTNIKTVGGVSILGSGDIPLNNVIGFEYEYWNTTVKTLSLSDSNKLFMSILNGPNQTVIIPKDSTVAFPVGTIVTFLLTTTNTIAFVGEDGGVTFTSVDGLVELKTQYAMASLIKIASNTWQLVGALE